MSLILSKLCLWLAYVSTTSVTHHGFPGVLASFQCSSILLVPCTPTFLNTYFSAKGKGNYFLSLESPRTPSFSLLGSSHFTTFFIKLLFPFIMAPFQLWAFYLQFSVVLQVYKNPFLNREYNGKIEWEDADTCIGDILWERQGIV